MPDTRAIAKCFNIIDLSRVPNELEPLRELLTRARWRVRTAAPGSPGWDAASTAVDDLEHRLASAKVGRSPDGATPARTAGPESSQSASARP